MDEIGDDRGVGNRIPSERYCDSCVCCWRRCLAFAAATVSAASGQKGQQREKKTRNDGGQASRYATGLCDSGQSVHVLFQKIGSARVDLGSIYFVRDTGQEEEHDCSNSKACAIDVLCNELIY
jgi:hypothetical protein